MEQTDMWMMKELSLSLGQTETIKLDNLKSSILDARARKYRENRDTKRGEKGRPAYWTDDTPVFAARCFEQTVKGTSMGSVGQGVRLIMDWGWHGGNRKKHATSTVEAEELAQCKLCHIPDSLAHIIWEWIEFEMQ